MPHRFDGLGHLKAWTDERLEAWSKRAICPATGETVEASWERELAKLRPLPILPEPFHVAVTRSIHKDCTVRFEGRSYAVPFVWVGKQVEVCGYAWVSPQDGSHAIGCPLCRRWSEIPQSALGTEIGCPNPDCNGTAISTVASSTTAWPASAVRTGATQVRSSPVKPGRFILSVEAGEPRSRPNGRHRLARS